MSMHFWDAYWGLYIEQCPCDVHFVDWLRAKKITNSTIYHFGSGGHHIVGIECAKDNVGNAVMSITAAPQEYDDYVKLLIEKPEVSNHYVCYFGDFYTVNARLVPQLDVLTLFHLCEFYSEKNAAYGGKNDLGATIELLKVTRPGGHVLFYTKSDGYEKTKPVIAELVAMGLIEPAGTHELLEIFTRTSKAA